MTADPLAHVRPGDPDPTGDTGPCCATEWFPPRGWGPYGCTRDPHPAAWQHIAGTGDTVAATLSPTGVPS